MATEYDYLLEICIFANEGVGKKTLLKNFGRSSFNHNLMRTIGIDFASKNLEIFGISVKLILKILNPDEQFWNEHGSKELLGRLIRNCAGALIMYDITDLTTLIRISEWSQIIRNNIRDIPILLVGNKLDLEDKRDISKEQLKKFKDDNKISSSVEISTKNGKNVERMFRKITRMMLRTLNYDRIIISPSPTTIHSDKLSFNGGVFLIFLLMSVICIIAGLIIFW